MGKDKKKFFASSDPKEDDPKEVKEEPQPVTEEVKIEEPEPSRSKKVNEKTVMVEIGKDQYGNATWKLMSPLDAKKFYKK